MILSYLILAQEIRNELKNLVMGLSKTYTAIQIDLEQFLEFLDAAAQTTVEDD